MFPLGSVLLPGAVLPLHVFEPRYQQMVRDILADDDHAPEFGVVMIERGLEVGGGEQRGAIGTTARIVDIRALDDGRYALAAVGTERMVVTNWLPDDPYPQAEIEPWPDEPDDSAPDDLALAGRVADLHERVRDLNREAAALGDVAADPDTEISDDPRLAVYHLGSLAPLGESDRYHLLAARSLTNRLDVLGEALDDAAAVLQFRRS